MLYKWEQLVENITSLQRSFHWMFRAETYLTVHLSSTVFSSVCTHWVILALLLFGIGSYLIIGWPDIPFFFSGTAQPFCILSACPTLWLPLQNMHFFKVWLLHNPQIGKAFYYSKPCLMLSLSVKVTRYKNIYHFADFADFPKEN